MSDHFDWKPQQYSLSTYDKEVHYDYYESDTEMTVRDVTNDPRYNTPVPASKMMPLNLNGSEAVKYAQYEDYDTEFKSPVRTFFGGDSEVGLVVAIFGGMGIIVSTGILFSFASTWELGPAPLLAGAATVGILDLPKRFSYRKNILRRRQISSTATRIKRMIQKTYKLKMIKVSEGYGYSWEKKRPVNFDSLAKAVLTNQPYSVSFQAENLRNHSTAQYELQYDEKKQACILYDKQNNIVVPAVQTARTVKVELEGETKALPKTHTAKKALEGPKRTVLPELTVATPSLAALPKKLRTQVQTVADSYNAIREVSLSVEDSYLVERVGADLQEAVNLFQTITRLRGENADQYVIKMLDKLSEEIEDVRTRTLDAAMNAIQSRQLYLEDR